ncbi:MAG: helix-turn-helix domain-containing protein [Agathobacter sp.]|nr:helix-turn-helix domain-containing protein [Agathobacter sp.]
MGKANERGAGRKPVFTDEQITELRTKRKQGITVSALAKEYGVSRQTLSAYLNKKDQQMEAIIESIKLWRELNRPFKEVNVVDYTMRMDFMCEDECCTQILVDFKHEKIAINNTTDKIMLRAFGININPTWEDFMEFLEERCFPRTRDNLKLILQDLELDFYDPLYIIEKTQGRMGEDMQWLKVTYLNPAAI